MADSERTVGSTCLRSISFVRKYNVSNAVGNGDINAGSCASPKNKHVSVLGMDTNDRVTLISARFGIDPTTCTIDTEKSTVTEPTQEEQAGAGTDSCMGELRCERDTRTHDPESSNTSKTLVEMNNSGNIKSLYDIPTSAVGKNTLLHLKQTRRTKSFHGREYGQGRDLQLSSQTSGDQVKNSHITSGIEAALPIKRAASLDSGSHSEPNSLPCRSDEVLTACHDESMASTSVVDLVSELIHDCSQSDSGVVSPRCSATNLDQGSELGSVPCLTIMGSSDAVKKSEAEYPVKGPTLASSSFSSDAEDSHGLETDPGDMSESDASEYLCVGLLKMTATSDGDPPAGSSDLARDPWNVRDDDGEDTDDDWEDFEPQAIVIEEHPPFEMGRPVISDCDVCLDHVNLNLRLCCQAHICSTCMDTYIKLEVVDSGNIKVMCPAINCESYVHRDEVVGRLSMPDKEKFYRFLVQANNEAHIKTCPRCSHITTVDMEKLHDPRSQKHGLFVVCRECALDWCFLCQAPFHEGITCKEHRKGDKLLKKWAKERQFGQANAQKCPKCKVFIQRTTGCDHMTCTRCSTSFCYRCGDRYRRIKFIGDHHSRFSILGCKYIFSADNTVNRRLVRGSIFGGKVLLAPLGGAVALGAGAVVLCGVLLGLPFYGFHILRKKRKAWARRKAMEADRQRWRLKLTEIHNAGDPYLDNWNRFSELGINMHRLNTRASLNNAVGGLAPV